MPIPKATSPLDIWLNYLQHLHVKHIDLGLERVRHVATNLGLLRPAPSIIIVGGTNGKGTTCRLLEMILIMEGIKVGVYSSPHLLRYQERVRIQGKELPEVDHSAVMAVIEAGREDTSLSYFEFSTLSAFQIFKQAELEVVILEVGLGGRLDATNIIDADVAVITSIALDHTNYLGQDRASIAKEKAGIFRSGKPTIIGEPDRPDNLDTVAANCGTILYARNRDWWYTLENNGWRWWDRYIELHGLPIPLVPLENAATALATVRHLPFNLRETSVRQALINTSLPGRLQVIGQQPLRILDVAHNPHAASYLSKYLLTLAPQGKVRAVVGMLADKDIAGTLACLRNQVDFWYCANLDDYRAASAAQLAAYLDSTTQQFTDVKSAWRQALQEATLEDCILVFGSFHTVAPIMALAEGDT